MFSIGKASILLLAGASSLFSMTASALQIREIVMLGAPRDSSCVDIPKVKAFADAYLSKMPNEGPKLRALAADEDAYALAIEDLTEDAIVLHSFSTDGHDIHGRKLSLFFTCDRDGTCMEGVEDYLLCRIYCGCCEPCGNNCGRRRNLGDEETPEEDVGGEEALRVLQGGNSGVEMVAVLPMALDAPECTLLGAHADKAFKKALTAEFGDQACIDELEISFHVRVCDV